MYSPILQGSVQHHNSDFRTVLTNANQGYCRDEETAKGWGQALDETADSLDEDGHRGYEYFVKT